MNKKLIQDITPPSQLSYDTVDEKPPVKRLSSDTLMNELWERGVTIQTIFGRFYELEAIADARSDEMFGNDEEGQHGRPRLTVGDAELAGVASLPEKPLTRYKIAEMFGVNQAQVSRVVNGKAWSN